MRLDPDHVRAIARCIETDADGETYLKIDIKTMRVVLDRLSLWERGLLSECLEKAARAKRKSRDQRALLAIFSHRGME